MSKIYDTLLEESQDDPDTLYWKAAQYISELEEYLGEAVDLMEDVRIGAYAPDSVTTQPWKRILSENTKD